MERYEYFNKAKKTLLMFRKVNKFDYRLLGGRLLELRHQRSSDIVFDFHCEGQKNGLDWKGLECVYRTIETLLPKSRDNPEVPKLAEIYGTEKTARLGWLTFYQG